MTLSSYTHCILVAGLHLATFYNPVRLCHQYGHKQLIPELVHEFEPGPLTQNFLDNLAATWPLRTIQRNLSYHGDPSTDDQYKAWIHLQQTEKDEFIRLRKTRELQASNVQNMQQKKRRQN